MAYTIDLHDGEDVGADAPTQDKRRAATRVQAGALKTALADVLGLIEARNTIPILAHAGIAVKAGVMTLSATNLDQFAVRTLATNDRDGPASADWVQAIRRLTSTVNAKSLSAILAQLDGEAMATLELVDSRLHISAGRALFKLPTLPVDDFPVPAPMSVEHCFELPAKALADAFARVEQAISSEETRYYLNGIFLHVVQQMGEPQFLCLATTDGHRLARLRAPVPDGAASWPDVILPRQAVAVLDKLLAACSKGEKDNQAPPSVMIEASAGGTSLRFTMEMPDGAEIWLQTKAIDGTFPDYTRVIPTDPPHRLVVGRAALIAAAKRVGVLAEDKTRAVKLSLSVDRIEARVTTPEIGEAVEDVPCSYEGPEMEIGVNGVYLREALGALATDEVAIAFTDPGAPLRLQGVGADVDTAALVQVLMPVRV